MILGTALGWTNRTTIVASFLLAFVFGYGLTSLPLLRSGLPMRRVAPLACGEPRRRSRARRGDRFPSQRWLIDRGKGHAIIHAYR